MLWVHGCMRIIVIQMFLIAVRKIQSGKLFTEYLCRFAVSDLETEDSD